MLDRFGRPALVPHFQIRALEFNQRALRLLREREQHDLAWSRSLFACVTAAAATWQLFRPLLDSDHWRRVKHSLRRQDRLLRPLRALEAEVLLSHRDLLRGLTVHAITDAQLRCVSLLLEALGRQSLPGLAAPQCEALERHFHDQSVWLGALTRSGAADEAAIRDGVVRVYRRARRSSKESGAAGKTRRRLAGLAWVEELVTSPLCPMLQGRLPDSPAGRLWLGCEEDRWLRILSASGPSFGLGRKDAAHLNRLVDRRRKTLAGHNRWLAERAVGETTGQFSARLPWMMFQHLSRLQAL